MAMEGAGRTQVVWPTCTLGEIAGGGMWEHKKKNCSEQQLWNKVSGMRTKDTFRRGKNISRL